MDIYEQVSRYRDLLQKRVSMLEKRLAATPEGSLHAVRHGERTAFYVRTCKDYKLSEQYIRIADKETAASLAEKRYIRKVLPKLRSNLRAACRFMSVYSGMEEDDAAGELPEYVLALSEGIYTSPEKRSETWLAQTWTQRPGYDGDLRFETLRGDLVRSKSEVLISDALYHYGIPYLYERPFCTDILRAPLFPDFTLYDVRTDREVFWEHFGMMDDSGYAERTCKKLSVYLNSGLTPGKDLICSFETARSPISSFDIDRLIRAYLIK